MTWVPALQPTVCTELTSVILKNLPFTLDPTSKKKRLWPPRTICPPVSVSVIVGGDGPGPTTVLLPDTAACSMYKQYIMSDGLGRNIYGCREPAHWVTHRKQQMADKQVNTGSEAMHTTVVLQKMYTACVKHLQPGSSFYSTCHASTLDTKPKSQCTRFCRQQYVISIIGFNNLFVC